MSFLTPEQQKQMAQLEQGYAQRKASLAQSFYQQQANNWNPPPASTAPVAVPAQNVNWIQVSGLDGARNQIVQPNQTAWMMDNNQPYFYVKSVDNVGSSTFRIFRFEEVADVVAEQPAVDDSNYVKREEFEELKAKIEQITATKKPAKASKEESDNV